MERAHDIFNEVWQAQTLRIIHAQMYQQRNPTLVYNSTSSLFHLPIPIQAFNHVMRYAFESLIAFQMLVNFEPLAITCHTY